jgi:catabolite regulation protein CreA
MLKNKEENIIRQEKSLIFKNMSTVYRKKIQMNGAFLFLLKNIKYG